jgi:phospholipid transport system substrate-binding protein
MKKLTSFLLILFIAILPARAEDQDSQELKLYVENLIANGYALLNNKDLDKQERIRQSSLLIKENLYLDWMAKYSLGRHRRSLSQDMIDQFTNVYSNFIVKVYSDLASHYSGEKAVIKTIKQIDEDMFIVNMEILKTNSAVPIRVEYLVHKFTNPNRNIYKVADVITEGISILNSQQSEFNSVISNQGIEYLINNLSQKINSYN